MIDVRRSIFFPTLLLAAVATLAAADDPVAKDDPVFKSDVAMSRVDVQVTDRDGRMVTGLGPRDFVVKVDGKVQAIKNFASENMPIDILLLLDVSGSMEPHVQRIAEASRQALNVLNEQDRMAIMIFDTRTREKLPFTGSRREVMDELNHLVRSESFNGGTRITSAMIDAAKYVQHHARPEARRAIVILTDDMTQDSEDEMRVEKNLKEANAVLSFLQAPYEEPAMSRGPMGRRGGGMGRGGGGWPGGGGGGWPGSGGGGWPGSGGGGWPGGGGGGRIPGGRAGGGDRSHTAGTEEIARDSGGDTLSVNEASALEDTLNRLRQRYTLLFYMPDTGGQGITADRAHSVRVDLSTESRIRYHDAEVRSRQVFMSGAAQESSGPTVVTHQQMPVDPAPVSNDDQPRPALRKGRAVSEDSGPVVNTVNTDGDQPISSGSNSTSSPNDNSAKTGGWPRADQTAPAKPHL